MILYVMVALATLVGMSVQSALGFGFVFFLGPVLLAAVPPSEALTIILTVGLIINVLVLFSEHRHRSIMRADLWVIVLSSLPGLIWGVLLLKFLPKHDLQVIIGVVDVIGVLLQYPRLRHHHATHRKPTDQPNLIGGTVTGIVAGALNTSTGLAAPPLIFWLTQRGARGSALRDTINAQFLGLNLLGGAVLATAGAYTISTRTVGIIIFLLPLVALGHMLGARVFRRIERKHYEKAVVAALLMIGLASIASGIF